jgi:predicted nucleic acid-binding protein
MRRKKDRIIIDTNLWISFLLSKSTSGLDRLLLEQSINLIFSQELLDEFIEVARRPKLKKYFNLSDLGQNGMEFNGASLKSSFVKSRPMRCSRQPMQSIDGLLLGVTAEYQTWSSTM